MNINRHNYEAFFLLYVDKELSAADRKAVELFVAENTDLAEELLMLQQTVIAPDAVVFDSKQLLLKEESITALQENLLLLADEELAGADKEELLQLIASDDAVSTEWNILQQTKLPAETIVFANKHLLYKKEPARVVGFNWKRIAAAAVFIGLVTWGGWKIFVTDSNKTNGGNEVANGNNGTKNVRPNTKEENIVAEKEVANTVTPVDAPDKTTGNDQIALTAPDKKSAKDNTTDKNDTPVQKTIDDNAPVKNENIATLVPKKETNNLPTPLYNNINNEPRNNTIIAAVPPKEEDNEKGNSQKGIALAGNKVKALQGVDNGTNPIAKAAVLNEGENGSFIDTDTKKRSKLGGFLRKVTRVITRTTNAPEGDGKSVKIAGFDIAIN